jgi:hypothetical protein
MHRKSGGRSVALRPFPYRVRRLMSAVYRDKSAGALRITLYVTCCLLDCFTSKYGPRTVQR